MIKIALKDNMRVGASCPSQFIDKLNTFAEVSGWKARPGSYVGFTCALHAACIYSEKVLRTFHRLCRHCIPKTDTEMR